MQRRLLTWTCQFSAGERTSLHRLRIPAPYTNWSYPEQPNNASSSLIHSHNRPRHRLTLNFDILLYSRVSWHWNYLTTATSLRHYRNVSQIRESAYFAWKWVTWPPHVRLFWSGLSSVGLNLLRSTYSPAVTKIWKAIHTKCRKWGGMG